jgi:hypothetical protein
MSRFSRNAAAAVCASKAVVAAAEGASVAFVACLPRVMALR